MSTYTRREYDAEWDSRSVASERRKGATVRRYKVNDEEDEEDYKVKAARLRINVREPERSRSNVRSDYYEQDTSERDTYRRERGSPERVRDIHITREISPPRRAESRGRDYEVEKITRSTEYYQPERSLQPIYIRTEAPPPIIIREPAAQQIVIRDRTPEPPRREEQEEVKVDIKSEVGSQRQVARRDPSPESGEDDDSYYFERTVRRIHRRPQESPEPDRHERQSSRAYSDDEQYYYRKTTEGYGSDGEDPYAHRRHLAEGAIAGGAVAGLLRHHRKKTGEASGGRGSGVGQVAGGAALGAAATEALSRARSFYRSRSRGARSRIDEAEGDLRIGRPHSREGRESRSRSNSGGVNKHDLVKLGAIAAIGAVAGYAASRRGKKGGNDDRRSRSRRRRGSRGRRDIADSGSESDDGDKKKGNAKAIAGTGLATAAVAGVVDHIRSKSKGRSRSKGRTAIPVVAAGLGGAALAGLYEANKKSKNKGSERRQRSPSRSPSRARSASRSAAPRSSSHARTDQNLIEYGTGDYYEGRARRRSSSTSVSPDRRLRSRSRGGEDADAAGQGAYAAHQRRERKRAERAQRQQEEDRGETPQQQPVAPTYGYGPYAQAVPDPNSAYQPNPYYQPPQANFAPPPANPYSPTPNIVGQQASSYMPPQNPPPDSTNLPYNPPYNPAQATDPFYPNGAQPPNHGGQGYRPN